MHESPKNEIEKSSAEAERLPSPERIKTAELALRNFLKLKPEEKVTILEDKTTNAETVSVLQDAIKNIGSPIQEIRLTKKNRKQELNELTKNSVIIDLAPDSEQATEDIYDCDHLKKSNSRLLNIFGLGPDAFNGDGAMNEKLEDLEFRLNKMEQVLKDAVGFKITSVYGTNLEVSMRAFKERRWYKDSGLIDESGKWGNLPGGEIFTTPDETKIRGTLVLPVLGSTITPEQGVDKFVRLTIRDGIIVSIQGGASAEKLQKQLGEDSEFERKEKRNPFDTYRIAEISFGANPKARSSVADPEQPYSFPAVSAVEAEKRFGTMHLAFGGSEHGEEGTEGFSRALTHYDFVIPRNGLTVEMFTRESDFKNKKNGRKIISKGGLNFF